MIKVAVLLTIGVGGRRPHTQVCEDSKKRGREEEIPRDSKKKAREEDLLPEKGSGRRCLL